MKVKVFEIFKSGLSPLSEEMETIIQDWLNENDHIEIVSTSQSQHLRENTVFVIFPTSNSQLSSCLFKTVLLFHGKSVEKNRLFEQKWIE